MVERAVVVGGEGVPAPWIFPQKRNNKKKKPLVNLPPFQRVHQERLRDAGEVCLHRLLVPRCPAQGYGGGGGQLEWHDRRARGRGCRCRPLHRDAVPVSVETLAPGKLPCRFRRLGRLSNPAPPPTPPHPTPPQPRATASRTSVSLGCRSWPAGMHGPAGTCAGWGPLDERPWSSGNGTPRLTCPQAARRPQPSPQPAAGTTNGHRGPPAHASGGREGCPAGPLRWRPQTWTSQTLP